MVLEAVVVIPTSYRVVALYVNTNHRYEYSSKRGIPYAKTSNVF